MMGTNTCSKLSHELLDHDFFPALGTTQTRCVGMKQPEEELRVKRGSPNTWDLNNGVVVIYDEDGRPWVKSAGVHASGVMRELARIHDLKRGAYVPHSNDGGHFMRRIMPYL